MTSTPADSGRDGSPLKIAFIAPEDRQTGTFFRAHNLARALIEMGHGVNVYSQSNVHRQGVAREVREGVPYILMPTAPGNRFLISPVNPVNIARRFLFNVEPADVYHLFQPYPSGAIAWLGLRERRRGLFAYDWDDFWMNDEFGLKRPKGMNARVTSIWVHFLERYLPSKCDLLTTLSHNIASLAHRLLAANTRIIYNGVWPEPLIDRRQARETLGLQQDAIYVGIMGWSGETEWTLAGLRQCARRFPQLRIASCGQDPSHVLARFPDLKDRVDVLGYLPAEKLPSFRFSVDLGLVPMSSSEFNEYRLPYKLTDFLAAGTPVLASAIGETTVLAESLPGIITCKPERDAFLRRFAETIADLAAEPQPRRVERDALFARFHWSNIARELVEAYRATPALGLSSAQAAV